MLARATAVYLATRKKHDLLFNAYFMRPLAAVAVVFIARTPATPNQVTLVSLAISMAGMGILAGMPTYWGALIAALVIELGYLLDCADGMLARHKGIASTEGHLFDFFTDELKAITLVCVLGVHLWGAGAYAPWGSWLPAGSAEILLVTLFGAVVIASATSLTNFVRRPEISGNATPIEAHYESVEHAKAKGLAGRAGQLVMTFLQFLNHYPSHIWLFAVLGRLDVFFWAYIAINLLYLARGWLGLVLRFGRPAA